MSDFEVKVYLAEEIKNNNMGNGSLRVGGLIARFSIWKNPKFNKGFSISFPYRKDGAGKIINEVYFLDKDLETEVYNIVESQVSGLLNGNGSVPSVNYEQSRTAPIAPPTLNTIQRQDVNASLGAPKDIPW